MKNEKYFIIKKHNFLGSVSYSIHSSKMYDVETAMRKILALDTLNEDRENNSYHLQKVDLSIVETPLVLTDEVKKNGEDINEDMPF